MEPRTAEFIGKLSDMAFTCRFTLRKVEPSCYRINDRFDIWLPSRRSKWQVKWRDLEVGDRGQKPRDQILYLIGERLCKEKR